MRGLPTWCVLMAVIYALLGMVMGETMAASGDHSLMPVHAHINLLGWVSLALFGIVYKVWNIKTGKLAWTQFGLFNLGIIVKMTSLTIILRGNEAVGPVAGIGSTLLILGMALFGWQLLRAPRS